MPNAAAATSGVDVRIKLSATPGSVRCAAPMLGQHNAAVREELAATRNSAT